MNKTVKMTILDSGVFIGILAVIRAFYGDKNMPPWIVIVATFASVILSRIAADIMWGDQ